MNVLEILLDRRWILKAKEKELYYRVKDELSSVRKFMEEKLGYHITVNPYLIKVQKIPARPENWMGIWAFKEITDYVYFCLVLMFLEGKEPDEQFVLSELTEYMQSQWKEESIDWTLYKNRRCLIRVMKYCLQCGMINIDDGKEENFASDGTTEVLYENTGTSRYFMRNFTQDIMGCQSAEDFGQEEWLDINEDRGIVRRQRVYRSLLMSMGLRLSDTTAEDFAYIRQFRNMIQGELSEWLDCDLQVHRTSAFLVLGEESRMGRCFPEENTLSDITLLCCQLILEAIKNKEINVPADEAVQMPYPQFTRILESCRERFGKGFIKTYREKTSGEFCSEIKGYMEEMELITVQGETVWISPVVGKLIGKYPDDFEKTLET